MTYRLLLLTSYCGDDNDACTDDFPCRDCLDMCNVMVSTSPSIMERMKNIGGFDFNRNKIDTREIADGD